MREMSVLWTHNYDPATENSGVFMHTAAEGLRARGVDLDLLYLGNLRSSRTLLRARKTMRQLVGEYDLVHAQYGSACAFATAGFKGRPKVVSIRGNDWNVHDASIGFHYVHTRLARATTRLAIGSYDCVTAVSNRMAVELSHVFPDLRVEKVPSPVDLDLFAPRDKVEARELLGYTGCTKKWILFNTLRLDDPIKRADLAKAAFDIANGMRGDLELRIATDLPHSEIPLLTAACDMTLCTSETEGWPNSVKEALACNVPFVSTDISDLCDIADQEATCRICAPDAEAIANAICEVLNVPEKPNVRRHVLEMSLDAVSDRLLGIYESLLSDPPRA